MKMSNHHPLSEAVMNAFQPLNEPHIGSIPGDVLATTGYRTELDSHDLNVPHLAYGDRAIELVVGMGPMEPSEALMMIDSSAGLVMNAAMSDRARLNEMLQDADGRLVILGMPHKKLVDVFYPVMGIRNVINLLDDREQAQLGLVISRGVGTIALNERKGFVPHALPEALTRVCDIFLSLPNSSSANSIVGDEDHAVITKDVRDDHNERFKQAIANWVSQGSERGVPSVLGVALAGNTSEATIGYGTAELASGNLLVPVSYTNGCEFGEMVEISSSPEGAQEQLAAIHTSVSD
ncbi:MAG: hypothetical protein AAF413_02495 [Patescibacteria group bacterium]